MEPETQKSLQWLGEQYYEELRSLRAAEDNLFSWATSLFLAGFGVLTGFKGMTGGAWSVRWRLTIMVGLLVIDGVILLMAYLIRRNYELNQTALGGIVAQLRQFGAPTNPVQGTDVISDRLYFYLRWGAVAAMGLITLALVWMLG